MGRAYWFTNLDTTKRHEPMTLFKRYTPDEYPTYTNYPAIEVSRVAEIPMDYDGEMGVPITFLDKYNPNQFKMIEQQMARKADFRLRCQGYLRGRRDEVLRPQRRRTHRRMYERIVIKRIGAAS